MIMKIKIGLFGIGLDTHWPQFDGLPDNLKRYVENNLISVLVGESGLPPSCEQNRNRYRIDGNFTGIGESHLPVFRIC